VKAGSGTENITRVNPLLIDVPEGTAVISGRRYSSEWLIACVGLL